MKTHFFKLRVDTHDTKKRAYYAVLGAFARRNPDGCYFYLTNLLNPVAKKKAGGKRK